MKSLVISKFLPFMAWLPLVDRASLRADFMAGLTGAVIVLPQGVAFATIAGLPPQYGLYTAMVTPIIAALFGSSRHLISGPTTAISIVVFTSISHHAMPGSPEFVSLALTLTFLAGVYQLAFGLARLGVLVNFVSHTVVMGFTAGAAILIATSQLKHILGIQIPRGDSFAHTWANIYQQLDQANLVVLGIALVTLLTAVACKRLFPRLPNLLLGLVTGSVVAVLVGGASHGVTFVEKIPAQLPPLSMPDFSVTAIRQLAPEAFAIALLGLIEAVSIARSVATKSHQRINSNQEFIGQGLSNMVGCFFSSYAGSGSFTRSGINYQAGARTPMAAIFAAATLMLMVLLIAPLTAYLPVAAMGGVILLVAYGLIDFHHIKETLAKSRSETSILLVTFFATLFLELEFAIYLGVLLSLILFLARTSRPQIVTLAPDTHDPKRKLVNVQAKPINECPQLKIIRIDRDIYFGSVNYIQSQLEHITEKQGIVHILIDASRLNYIDMAGAEMLVQESRRLRARGGGLYFCALNSSMWQFLAEGKYVRAIGADVFFNHKSQAIAAIFRKMDKD
ncbi:MAG: sulfate permease, partial [Gammaproteobacteria bacterium]